MGTGTVDQKTRQNCHTPGDRWHCPGDGWCSPGDRWHSPGNRWHSPGDRWRRSDCDPLWRHGGETSLMKYSGNRDHTWDWLQKKNLKCLPRVQLGDFPGGPVVRLTLPTQAVWVRSLVGELRFCMPYIRVKKQSIKKERFNLSKRKNNGTTETEISRWCFHFSPLSMSRPPLLGSSSDIEVSLTFRMPPQGRGRVHNPNPSPCPGRSHTTTGLLSPHFTATEQLRTGQRETNPGGKNLHNSSRESQESRQGF